MYNLLAIVRELGRLACIWVPTGNSRTPLMCVWSVVKSSRVTSTAPSSSNDETGGLRLCA